MSIMKFSLAVLILFSACTGQSPAPSASGFSSEHVVERLVPPNDSGSDLGSDEQDDLAQDVSDLFGDGTATDVTCVPGACCHFEPNGCKCCCRVNGGCSCGCP